MIETHADPHGSPADTRLRVFNRHREHIATNDNGVAGVDSRVFFTPDTTDYYYPLVTHSRGPTGPRAPYAISILEN